MDEESLRIKIYEHLGLEFGSLSSEGGNDWVRAEKEVLEEYKQEQLNKLSQDKSIDFLNIDKKSKEFQFVLSSTSVSIDWDKISISNRNDLDDFEITELIKSGSKDVLINLVKRQTLSEEHIELIIPKSVYLVKKYLIENQKLTEEQKKQLLEIMYQFENTYTELINKIK